MSIHSFTVKDAENNDISLSDYKGKVLLIVNTATECGLTPQYEDLQKLYEKYNSKGFEILDFPCNQFAGQAPGTEKEIISFCKARFGTTFKTFAKIDVNGENESDLYKYLKEQKPEEIENAESDALKERLAKNRGQTFEGSKIKWNFTKFLIDKEGNVIERFFPNVKPEEIEQYIEKLL